MDDAIHVEIEAVELWYSVLRYQLRDGWIPFAHPSKELWYSHTDRANALGVLECVKEKVYVE